MAVSLALFSHLCKHLHSSFTCKLFCIMGSTDSTTECRLSFSSPAGLESREEVQSDYKAALKQGRSIFNSCIPAQQLDSHNHTAC